MGELKRKTHFAAVAAIPTLDLWEPIQAIAREDRARFEVVGTVALV